MLGMPFNRTSVQVQPLMHHPALPAPAQESYCSTPALAALRFEVGTHSEGSQIGPAARIWHQSWVCDGPAENSALHIRLWDGVGFLTVFNEGASAWLMANSCGCVHVMVCMHLSA